MKAYLFDASSILNLIKKGVTEVFLQGVTINLAEYEALNAIWKEYKLLKRINEETALEYVDIVANIFKVIEKLSIEGNEEKVFKLASKENLTIYDASYISLAAENKLTLVTDDQKLKEKASKHIKAINSNQIQ